MLFEEDTIYQKPYAAPLNFRGKNNEWDFKNTHSLKQSKFEDHTQMVRT